MNYFQVFQDLKKTYNYKISYIYNFQDSKDNNSFNNIHFYKKHITYNLPSDQILQFLLIYLQLF